MMSPSSLNLPVNRCEKSSGEKSDDLLAAVDGAVSQTGGKA